jgi:hypothetical protein
MAHSHRHTGTLKRAREPGTSQPYIKQRPSKGVRTPSQLEPISRSYHRPLIPRSVFSSIMPVAIHHALTPSADVLLSALHSASHESKVGPGLSTGPDGRRKSRKSVDSNRNRRLALSFPSLRNLASMLGRPRQVKSANAGLLD